MLKRGPINFIGMNVKFLLLPMGGILSLFYLAGFIAVAQAQIKGKYDFSKPIQINADALEVQQDNSIAVFSGNVDAIQGQLRLKAEKVTVHYQTQKGSRGAGGTISKIVAAGGVLLSTPEETAKGQSGTYDVVNRIITMSGDVVLTRQGNVLRGKTLKLNLETGKSRLEGGQKGRITAIVKPPQKQKK